PRTVGPAQGDLLGPRRRVRYRRPIFDRGRAADARKDRTDLHLRQIGALDRPQVDLLVDPAEVPPPAGWPLREGGRGAAVVDAHDQPVDAAVHAGERELERQVGPEMAAELAAVEPHGRGVVDRLKADDPAAE